jgi:hypothetical protein
MTTPLDEMIEFVTSNDRLMPWPSLWVTDEILVVGELNHDNEINLEVYKKTDLLAWHTRAQDWLVGRDPNEYQLHEALYETSSESN